jgi:tetratricopeptide (TPR) repeat protein
MGTKMLTAAAFALLVGCGDYLAQSSVKYIEFSVNEGGATRAEKKFFMDSYSDKDPRNQAFWLAQKGDMPAAKKTLDDAIAKEPDDLWLHYDLGILHEATGDWDKAESEMKLAAAINGKEDRVQKELKFIPAHKRK